MTTYVSVELRRFVADRARAACEYCRIHEADTFLGCQVDHIVSEKHGGATIADNLAFACVFCNRSKGTDVGSLTSNGQFVRFFNPRVDSWNDHFTLEDASIVARSDIGEVTTKILGFNAPERLLERKLLIKVGRYPPTNETSRTASD